jgi:hypothetical protein
MRPTGLRPGRVHTGTAAGAGAQVTRAAGPDCPIEYCEPSSHQVRRRRAAGFIGPPGEVHHIPSYRIYDPVYGAWIGLPAELAEAGAQGASVPWHCPDRQAGLPGPAALSAAGSPA